MRKSILVGMLCILVAACRAGYTPVDDRNSSMTQGNVQMNVDVDKTTKTQILECQFPLGAGFRQIN